MSAPLPRVGDVIAWERTFTVDDVRAFSEIAGDTGRHHVEPDAHGRLIVHGLLVATLPTHIGGSLDFLARDMVFEFLRPVFTGDRIRCEVTVTGVELGVDRANVTFMMVCRNPDLKEVMRGSAAGIIRMSAPG